MESSLGTESIHHIHHCVSVGVTTNQHSYMKELLLKCLYLNNLNFLSPYAILLDWKSILHYLQMEIPQKSLTENSHSSVPKDQHTIYLLIT